MSEHIFDTIDNKYKSCKLCGFWYKIGRYDKFVENCDLWEKSVEYHMDRAKTHKWYLQIEYNDVQLYICKIYEIEGMAIYFKPLQIMNG